MEFFVYLQFNIMILKNLILYLLIVNGFEMDIKEDHYIYIIYFYYIKIIQKNLHNLQFD
jgi:hypothetical protein